MFETLSLFGVLMVLSHAGFGSASYHQHPQLLHHGGPHHSGPHHSGPHHSGPHHESAHHPEGIHHPHAYHHPEPIGDKSAQFKSQDIYGNYGFGYHSHTIKGDGEYRYERKTGGHTEGGYGFSSPAGAVTMDFFDKQPHSPFVPTYYDGHHDPMAHVIKDIPPAPSVHIPAVPVHPLEGMPLEKGQLQAAASDIIERSSGQTQYAGPRYHSLYDVTIPHHLYKPVPIPAVLSNALPGLPIEADAEHHASLISEQQNQRYDPMAMHAAYMSFIDKFMPMDGLHGVHMNGFNPPIKRK